MTREGSSAAAELLRRATPAQQKALVAMAKALSRGTVDSVVEVSPAAIQFVDEHFVLVSIAIARRDPPRLVRGDLSDDLAPLAAQAPQAATLVVFHSAVLGYITPQETRDQLLIDADIRELVRERLEALQFVSHGRSGTG